MVLWDGGVSDRVIMSGGERTSWSPNAPANEEYSRNHVLGTACTCHQYSSDVDYSS